MPPPSFKRSVILGALLALATIIAYAPSLRGDFLWDDPDHIVNNHVLRDAHGLRAIWTDFHSIPQWYPLVHTTFWVEYHLWNTNPVGYRIDNLLLHIATALLLWRLLKRLGIPGCFFAAAIFALHPVHVESVAWITERKNVLSGFFYVLAFWMYWRGIERRRYYALALICFACALLSKTVTASFPAAMLLVLWWKRGKLTWRDVAPLIPFFVLGAALGWNTARLEQQHVGAFGREWDMSFAQRVLVAGRAVWFYASKLVVPVDLSFMYERWKPDAHIWVQWVYPLGAAIVVGMLVVAKKRGALVAVLLFGGTLLPALGFFNVYPHRYSFVADHFQYLASIALIVPLATGLHRQRFVAIAVVLALGVLTWKRAHVFDNPLALWTDATERCPGNFNNWSNLGKELKNANRNEQAIAAHQRAFDLNKDVPDTWYNVAMIDAAQGKWNDAITKLTRAVELTNPGAALRWDAMIRLGWCEEAIGNPGVARKWLARAVDESKGSYPPAVSALEEFDLKRGPASRPVSQ